MGEKVDYEEYKKHSYSDEERKIMAEIDEKLQNKETVIAALELIEQHLGEISPMYLLKTKDLLNSENQEIREKADSVLKKCHEEPECKENSEKIDELQRGYKDTLRQFDERLQKALAPPQAPAITKLPESITILLEESQQAIQFIKSMDEIQKSYEELAKPFGQLLQPLIHKEEIMPIITHVEDTREQLRHRIDFLENELMKKEEECEELREVNKELHEMIRKLREAENEFEHLPYIL